MSIHGKCDTKKKRETIILMFVNTQNEKLHELIGPNNEMEADGVNPHRE